MVVFNYISGPEFGDPRGGGLIVSAGTGVFFAVMGVALWRARDQFLN